MVPAILLKLFKGCWKLHLFLCEVKWNKMRMFECVISAEKKCLEISSGVVPKGLLTFLGSLYEEVVKTTPRILVYRFERQTARKNFFFLPKTLSSTTNVRFYLRNLQIASVCILMSYFMESKLKKIPIDRWWRLNTVKIGFPDFSRQ